MAALRKLNTGIASLTCVLWTIAASAQAPGPQYPQTNYPQDTAPQQGYPPGAYPQAAYPQPATPEGGKPPSPLRQVFAGTLAALLQSATGGIGNALAEGINGSINGWFERKQRKNQRAQGGYAGEPAYQGQSAYPAAPAYDTTSAYPATTYPPTQPSNPYSTDPYNPGAAYPSQNAAGAPIYTSPAQSVSYDWSSTQVYDPRTGQASAAGSGGYALASPPADASTIAAGGAYDVYAMRADGSEVPVNAATQDFRTGDRFKVYFRPSLPGRLDVYNINPNGRETRIDSTETAAGQLTTLGPYEFTATRGNEALRFVLAPCTSQQLMVATRDIVNVGPNAGNPYAADPNSQAAYPSTYQAAQPAGLSLGSCSNVATRGIKTRDITKVGVDGTTSFALDPVSQSELASGRVAPREFTVYFRHN